MDEQRESVADTLENCERILALTTPQAVALQHDALRLRAFLHHILKQNPYAFFQRLPSPIAKDFSP